ncbi:hypothetical protein MELE44368_02360 [Mycolicibacterium elephantis DSM 44368]|uniref:Uncharacterized protein n=1 Tax=Mycolicibacterium elephantis DSM 44368 TaxID=1335622 RepID=A0A439DUV9_9MYCO|nr:hypothetical protein MELE44368_02360 [Mycolicibacterium elephantis DSM 44368]
MFPLGVVERHRLASSIVARFLYFSWHRMDGIQGLIGLTYFDLARAPCADKEVPTF